MEFDFVFSATPEGEQTDGESFKKQRAKHQMNAVYGSSSKAGKPRRCGECEGCMRDDCGQCLACLDKPRFGGRGTKKKACVSRTCRMKGPASEGQAMTVNLQEGQTYQIMGYLDGDKAVVKPVQTPAPTVMQPSSPTIVQPSAPIVVQPSSPTIVQPSAPIVVQPSAPTVVQPSATQMVATS